MDLSNAPALLAFSLETFNNSKGVIMNNFAFKRFLLIILGALMQCHLALGQFPHDQSPGADQAWNYKVCGFFPTRAPQGEWLSIFVHVTTHQTIWMNLVSAHATTGIYDVRLYHSDGTHTVLNSLWHTNPNGFTLPPFQNFGIRVLVLRPGDHRILIRAESFYGQSELSASLTYSRDAGPTRFSCGHRSSVSSLH
jgi:hypothetical protein